MEWNGVNIALAIVDTSRPLEDQNFHLFGVEIEPSPRK